MIDRFSHPVDSYVSPVLRGELSHGSWHLIHPSYFLLSTTTRLPTALESERDRYTLRDDLNIDHSNGEYIY